MNDAANDALIPLNQAVGTLIPGNHNPSTVWRWVMRGLAGTDGQRIRLKVTYVGRTPFTTAADVQTWLDAVTAARLERSQQTLDTATADELADRGLAGSRR